MGRTFLGHNRASELDTQLVGLVCSGRGISLLLGGRASELPDLALGHIPESLPCRCFILLFSELHTTV